MIRVLLLVLLLFAFALGLAWLAERPGEVAITWLGYDIHTSLTVVVVAFLLVMAVLALLWTLLRWLFLSPTMLGRYFAGRRRDRGYAALSRGMIAVGAGDTALAMRHAADATRLLDDEPLTLLLQAQTAQLRRDLPMARAAFETMLQKPETRLLGLHGLYVEARRQAEHEAARHYAEEALRLQLNLSWAGPAVFEYQAAAGEWHAARRTLAANRRAKLIDTAQATRFQAVLETAEAMSLEPGRPEEARVLALDAHRRAPGLVEAAVVASRLCARLGDVRRAARVVERSWREEPHPELAEAYKLIRPGDSVRDRLKRVRRLADIRANHREGRLAVAEAAVEARSWAEAREAVAADATAPTERVCLILAAIAAGEGDDGLARDWLARAQRAPRDAAWVADGVVFDRWVPISPITGRLDAFEWKVPEDRMGRLGLPGSQPGAHRLQIGSEVAAAPSRTEPEEAEQAILTELDLAPLAAPPPEPAPPPKPAAPVPAASAASAAEAAITFPAAGGSEAGSVVVRPPDDPGPDSLDDLRIEPRRAPLPYPATEKTGRR